MAFDGLVLSRVAREMADQLVGGRIDKVQQPTADDVVFVIRAQRTNYRLLLSANKSYPRVHLTTRFIAPMPSQAPMFCMLLRKHLESGTIVAITQWKRERILFIDVQVWDELGERVTRRIVVEIMGKHSNVILLDRPDGMIIDAATHISRAVSRHREVLPGKPYVFPPAQDKYDPLHETAKGFTARRLAAPDPTIAQFVVNTYYGISPFLGKEVAFQLRGRDRVDVADEWRAFADLLQQASTAENPGIVRDAAGSYQAFYLFHPAHVEGTFIRFASVNDCVDAFFAERALSDIARSRAGSYYRLIRTEREKAVGKIEKFRALLDAADDAEAWRVAGELLTAYVHQVEKGATEVVLPNFYDDERPQRIELDPAKSPLENANAYFRRYARYKKGIAVTQEQLQAAQEDALYLDSVLHSLETARAEELSLIEDELRETGYLKATRTISAKKKGTKKSPNAPSRVAPAVYQASDGTPVWIGRNNKENDVMTTKLAKKTDTWLHVKDAPGSHVIIPVSDPSDATLQEAAMLAAHFSRQRDSSKVEVDVVPVKQIWKPNGARPGFVLFEGQRTLTVTLHRDTIEALLASRETHRAANV